MKINFKPNESSLKINGQTILVPAKILQVFEYKDKAIVIADPYSSMQNVFCYDTEGKFLWTIQKAEYFEEDGLGYEGVNIGELKELKGKLIASCRGRPFFLDIDTGKVTFIPGNFER